jgi:hypothetical protein
VSVEERRLVRKLDRRILPITCLMYLFACQYIRPVRISFLGLTPAALDLDRSNLGNARLQGLATDVLGGDPTGKRFDWVNSIFFLSYVGCRVPAVEMRRVSCCIRLDFMHGSSYPPRQTHPSSTLVGFGGCRLGYLLHPHGRSPLPSTEGQQSHLSGSPM